MSFEIDFFYNEDTSIKNIFQKLANEKKYKINYIPQNKINIKNKNTSLIFFEEESFITSSELFKNIINIYNKKPASIIISKNPDIYNVVQWMRFGASDYLLQNNLNSEILNNSITGSLEYGLNFTETAGQNNKINVKDKPVEIPDNINWDLLNDNDEYEYSLLMFEIIFKNDSNARYSKTSIENIYTTIINEIGKIAQCFAGKLWFWNNNTGALIFHFGDHINTAVLTAIQIYNNFFFLCVDALKINEILDFKLVIHTGIGIYNSIHTDQITSDLINSTAHLVKLNSKIDTLNITENVYNKLNKKLIKYFKKIDSFEKRKIYEYVFYNY